MLGGLRTTTTRCSSSIFLKNLYSEFMDVLFIYNNGKGKKFFHAYEKQIIWTWGEVERNFLLSFEDVWWICKSLSKME